MAMIINRDTKAYESQPLRRYPANWNGDGWLPVPPRLTARAEAYAPYCDLVIEDGELADILPLPKPTPPPAPPTEPQLLGQQITDEQLERIALGQANTDLELAMLGGIANV